MCAICFPQLTSASHHVFFQPRDERAGTGPEAGLAVGGMLAAQEPAALVKVVTKKSPFIHHFVLTCKSRLTCLHY